MKNFYLNKKKAATLLAGTICISSLCGCVENNKENNNYKIAITSEYNKAVIILDNSATIIEISSWSRPSNAENLEIETKDGIYIYTNTSSTYLINDLNTDYTAYDFARTLVGDDGEIRYFGSIDNNTKIEEKVYTNN